MLTRRHFLAVSAGVLLPAPHLQASPLGLPMGLQLYTIGDALRRSFDGALKQVAAMGYRAVETNLSLGGHDSKQLKQIFADLGLNWDSAHCAGDELLDGLDVTVERADAAGLKYVVCAFPPLPHDFEKAAAGLSRDDWKANAALFNRIGEKLKYAGIQFASHNHNLEFRPLSEGKEGETTGYDILLSECDPHLVKFELDCGWMASAGLDPADYLARYPDRYAMLHIKDLKRDHVPNTELKIVGMPVGMGIVNWKQVFAAARKAGIKAYYVELEPPFLRSSLEDVKASRDYLFDLS